MSSQKTPIRLSQALANHESDRIAGHSDHGPTTWGEFRKRVSNLASCIAMEPGVSTWLLYCENLEAYSVALCAALSSSKRILLLPNDRPATLARAGSTTCGLLTDKIPPDHDIATIRVDHIDAESICDEATFDSNGKLIELLTSGSTGEPKLVTKSLHQLEMEVATLEELWGNKMGEATLLFTVSPQHIYGLLFCSLWPLITGRSVFYRRITMPHELVPLGAQLNPVYLVSSPAHLKRIPNLLSLRDLSGPCNLVFSSGGPLAKSTASQFHVAMGMAPIEVLGSTETGGVAYRQQDKNNPNGYWSTLPDVDIHIDKKADGELMIRSPYAQPGAKTWHRMGDKAIRKSATTFHLVGRLNRIIKVEEKRLSLDELEQRLLEHTFVDDCAIVPLQDHGPSSREFLGALIKLTDPCDAKPDIQRRKTIRVELEEHLKSHFESTLLPKRWRFVDDIPVNPQGKRILQDLAAHFSEPPSSPTEPVIHHAEVHGDQVTLSGEIGPDLACLQGHFPGMPIVAGIAQVDWAKRWASRYLGAPLTVKRLKAIKFQKLLLPGNRFTAILHRDRVKKLVRFEFQHGSSSYSSGRWDYD